MYYIVDVDTQEVLAQADSWQEAFNKELSLQRNDADCEVYRDYEIVESEE